MDKKSMNIHFLALSVLIVLIFSLTQCNNRDNSEEVKKDPEVKEVKNKNKKNIDQEPYNLSFPDFSHIKPKIGKDSSPSAKDFIISEVFIYKLRDATEENDPISLYIKKKLSEQSNQPEQFMQHLEGISNGEPPSLNFLSDLETQFNLLIKDHLYKEEIFSKKAELKLSKETEELLSKAKDLEGEELRRFNLLLLKDIYPEIIDKVNNNTSSKKVSKKFSE